MSTVSKNTFITALIVVGIIGLVLGYLVGAVLLKPAPPPAPAPAKKKYTIYYISHGGPGDPWWAPVIKGAQVAGELVGAEVVYLGPEKFSIKALVDLLEGAIAKNPDAIIITITSYEALDEPLRRAIDKGIPIFAVNVYDPRSEEERIPYLGYVGQDDYEAGKVLAEAAIRIFKEKTGSPPKRIVIGIHEVGHVGLEMRAKGITEVAEAQGIPVEKLDITTDPTKALEILKSYLAKNPDTDLILTLGPLGAHPAMKLIEEQGLKGKVYVATVDVDSEILNGIKEGVMLCAISQQPFAQGFLPVIFAYLYLEYGVQVPVGNVPLHVRTGPLVITEDLISVVEKQVEKTGGA
ncbi:MAG: sugar ABC transporter substrate-binding protein [Thermoprotei archaeon]|nr:MAG: sugar ABC transporter substrate-binding protein [Thermoprotei archaeon]